MSAYLAVRNQGVFLGSARKSCRIGRAGQVTGPAHQTAQTEPGTVDLDAHYGSVVVLLRTRGRFSTSSSHSEHEPSFYSYQKRFFPIHTARNDLCDSATAGNTLDLGHSILDHPKSLSSDQRTPKTTREFAVVFISNYVANLGEIWRAE
jgi:hypothetical protein